VECLNLIRKQQHISMQIRTKTLKDVSFQVTLAKTVQGKRKLEHTGPG